MKFIPSHERLNLLKQELQRSGKSGTPMDIRLFLFLIVLVLTIVLGVIAILLLTGTFTAGLSESEKIIEDELLLYVNLLKEIGKEI